MSKKWVISTCILLVILALASQALLHSRFISTKIRRLVETRLEAALGQEVEIGDIRLRLISTALVLSDISTKSNTAALPSSFLAEEVRVNFGLASFFTETFLIHKIEIDKPVIVLAPASPKKDPQFIKQTNTTSAGPPRAVVIRSLHVNGGTLRFKGAKIVEAFSLSNIDGVIQPNLEMDRFEIELQGNEGHYAIEGMTGTLDRLEGKMIVHPEKIDLKMGHLVSEQTSIIARGNILLPEALIDLNVDLKMPLHTLDSLRVAGGSHPILHDMKISGDLGFHGDVTGAYPKLALQGKALVTKLSSDGKEVGALTAEVAYREGRVSVSSLSGNLFSGTLSGKVEADIGGTPGPPSEPSSIGFDGNLQYEQIPIYRIVTMLPKETLEDKKIFEEIELLRGIFLSGDFSFSRQGLKTQTFTAEGRIKAETQTLFAPPVPARASRLRQLSAVFQKGNAAWRWSENHLALSEGFLFFQDTHVGFQGSWQGAEGWVLEMGMESKEMRSLANAIQIPLSGRSKINGTFRLKDTPAFKGHVSLERAEVYNIPLEKFHAAVDLLGSRIVLKQGVLKGRKSLKNEAWNPPPSDYKFSGNLNLEAMHSPEFDFQVNVLSGNPQEVFRVLRLPIPLYTTARGHLKIKGAPKKFFVKGPLTLSQGSLYGETFDRGRVDLTVDEKAVTLKDAFLGKGDSRLVGDGAIAYDKTYRLALEGRNLRIQETGFIRSRAPTLAGDVALTVTGAGRFERLQFQFDANLTGIRYAELAAARGTIKAEWKHRTLHIEGTFPENAVSLSGEIALMERYPFTFQSRFDHFQIDPLFKKILSGPAEDLRVTATGTMNGDGHLDRLDQINLSGLLTHMSARFGDYTVENDGLLPIDAKKGAFTFDKARFKGNNTKLVLDGRIAVLEQWDLFLKGEADLSLITFFSKEVESGRGKVHLDLAVSEQWLSPKIRGQITLSDGRIRTAVFPQNFHIELLSVLFSEHQLILETFEGKLGGGRVSAQGKARLSGFGLASFGFFLNLDNARVHLATDFPVTLAGELLMKRQKNRQTLKGDLLIKNLRYKKKIDLKTIVGDFRDKEVPIRTPDSGMMRRTELNIHISGDKDIQIENNLANIPLAVDLLLKGTMDKPLLIGRVNVPKGAIYFQRNTFRVDSGSVDFLNPERIDPTFVIKATTDIRNVMTERNYKVDLDLSGTLSQITLTLNSFPTLPKDDILALLTIGKTTADLDRVKGGAGGEATGFAVNQFLSDSVEQITGIVEDPVEKLTGTRIQVEPYLHGTDSRSNTGTRLTAEKHLLKERLLVVYSTTLDPSEEDLIRMIYEINKNISLVGNRDENGQIGGDIRFRFEFQ
ncbi:MAG: translocation/assembly module TamB domain-containing protein [Nitrospiria bacterium]